MKTFLIILLVTVSNVASAQLFTESNFTDKRFETELMPGGFYISSKNRVTHNKSHIFAFDTYLTQYCQPFKNTGFYIGAKGLYGISWSNDIKVPNVYGAGPAVKYTFPKTINHKFFKRLRLFMGVDYMIRNYTTAETVAFETEEFTVDLALTDDKMKYSYTTGILGFKVNASENLSFEINGMAVNHKGEYDLGVGLSMAYAFNNFKRQSHPKPKEETTVSEMKPKEPNQFFFNSFKVGSSLTYIFDKNTIDYPEGEHLYKEYTWNINFAASITKHLDVGLQFMNIFTSGTHVNNNYYTIYGAFAQYDLLANRSPRYSLFLESSINRGNYCTAGHLDPYKKNNIWYAGLGAGIELPADFLLPGLGLELSFFNYQIINQIQTKYNFTQYIVGLNYHIGKPRKYK
jgi:hypothetical protein